MLNINRGSHFLLTEAVKKTALQNQLTEVDALKCPPRLIDINWGGCFNVNVSGNMLTKASLVNQPPRLIRPSPLAHTTHLRVCWLPSADSPVLGRVLSASSDFRTFYDFRCLNIFFYFGRPNFTCGRSAPDGADHPPANPWSWIEGADGPAL